MHTRYVGSVSCSETAMWEVLRHSVVHRSLLSSDTRMGWGLLKSFVESCEGHGVCEVSKKQPSSGVKVIKDDTTLVACMDYILVSVVQYPQYTITLSSSSSYWAAARWQVTLWSDIDFEIQPCDVYVVSHTITTIITITTFPLYYHLLIPKQHRFEDVDTVGDYRSDQTVRMEWALLSIEVRGQQENFTDPAPLEGSCNIDVQCVMYTNLTLFLIDELTIL